MDINIVYVIWPDGESPDKAYSFTDAAVFDTARHELDEAGVAYGHALIPLIGDQETLNYIRAEMIKEKKHG